jgi:hypothetical protein
MGFSSHLFRFLSGMTVANRFMVDRHVTYSHGDESLLYSENVMTFTTMLASRNPTQCATEAREALT